MDPQLDPEFTPPKSLPQFATYMVMKTLHGSSLQKIYN